MLGHSNVKPDRQNASDVCLVLPRRWPMLVLVRTRVDRGYLTGNLMSEWGEEY